jgi:hypothetical protein
MTRDIVFGIFVKAPLGQIFGNDGTERGRLKIIMISSIKLSSRVLQAIVICQW